MRKEGHKIRYLVLAIALLSAVNVYADIAGDSSAIPKPLLGTASLPTQPIQPADQAVPPVGSSAFGIKNCLYPDDPFAFNPLRSGSAGNSAPESAAVKELPAGPDSAMLFLCALGSVGIFQAGRSAKKLNFALVPDWYHSAGPRQIGHIHVVSADLSLLPLLPAEFFNQPSGEPKISYHALSEAKPRFESQFSLALEAPRGPPSLS